MRRELVLTEGVGDRGSEPLGRGKLAGRQSHNQRTRDVTPAVGPNQLERRPLDLMEDESRRTAGTEEGGACGTRTRTRTFALLGDATASLRPSFIVLAVVVVLVSSRGGSRDSGLVGLALALSFHSSSWPGSNSISIATPSLVRTGS